MLSSVSENVSLLRWDGAVGRGSAGGSQGRAQPPKQRANRPDMDRDAQPKPTETEQRSSPSARPPPPIGPKKTNKQDGEH